MDQKTGIQRALDQFEGSASKLAKAAGGEITRQNVEHWQKVGRVAMDKCGYVRAATGISLQELNDTVNWDSILVEPPVETPAGDLKPEEQTS